MNWASEAVTSCEILIRKHAPLYLKVGEPLKDDSIRRYRVYSGWKAAVHPRTIAAMRRMRGAGVTIGEIARKYRVSWSTALKHTTTK